MFREIGGTATGAFALAGTLVTIAAMASIVKNGLNIDLYGLPSVLYSSYRQVRDPIFDLLFAWLPFVLPWYVKDAITAYLAIGANFGRAMIFGEPGGNQMRGWRRYSYQARLTLLWPRGIWLFWQVFKLVGRARLPLPTDHYSFAVRHILWLFIATTAASVLGVMALFLWNYVEGEALDQVTTLVIGAA